MIQNILLTMCFDCGNGLHEIYREMGQVCVASFRRYLKGPFEHLAIEGQVASTAEMFERVFDAEQEVFRSESVNLFQVGGDTLCVRPLQVFGEFGEFRMFGEALSPDRDWDLSMIPRYLCGCHYFPAGLDENVWKLQAQLRAELADRRRVWGWSQYIYNRMYYSQGLKGHEPEIDLLLNSPTGQQVGEKTKIVHFHGTRGAQAVLDRMRRTWSEYGQG